MGLDDGIKIRFTTNTNNASTITYGTFPLEVNGHWVAFEPAPLQRVQHASDGCQCGTCKAASAQIAETQAHRDRLLRDAAFYMLSNGQREGGVSLSFMTPNERKIGSEEWSARLRGLVKASAEKERNQVRIDIQCED